MLSLSQVLELAGMKKGNFDARRARDLLNFCPLDVMRQEDELDQRPAARNKYTLADAVALDLFENCSDRRLPAEMIDTFLKNHANLLEEIEEQDGDDLFIAVSLFSPNGRHHHRVMKTLKDIVCEIAELREPSSEIILLNVSEARRRVIARLEKMSRATA
jgi:sulfite reductase beta subunit-like hemoprotein